MGSLIIEEAGKDPTHFTLAGGIEHAGHPQVGQPLAAASKIRVSTDLKALLPHADLLIEFTTPEASLEHARLAADAKVAMIIGTTGFTEEQFSQLRDSSRRIPIFWSPNMSTGVLILRRLIGEIAVLLQKLELSEHTEVKISETHHIKKKDKPSGTAKQLAEDLRRFLFLEIKDGDIESKREDDVVGLHSVVFQCGSERIKLEHEAMDRRIFAQGALRVAKVFRKFAQTPRLYEMYDYASAMQQAETLKRGA